MWATRSFTDQPAQPLGIAHSASVSVAMTPFTSATLRAADAKPA
jgi:hypothetical protein